MEAIVPHLKHVRGRGVIHWFYQHINLRHISPGYIAYLNIDEEMIDRALIVGAKSNLKRTRDKLNKNFPVQYIKDW